MKVAVIGNGNVGGALADLWERAGHEVTRIGREGGDVSDAVAMVVAGHGGTIREALDNVQGLEGKTVIDATNLLGVNSPEGFSSNVGFVKSRHLRASLCKICGTIVWVTRSGAEQRWRIGGQRCRRSAWTMF